MRYTAEKCTFVAELTPTATRRRHFASLAVAGLSLLLTCSAAFAQVNVYTRSYDAARTGANLNETILTPANVSPATFGKLYTIPTDGQIYAQPLYVSGLNIAGGTHNVVFAATMLNSIYAVDADTGASLWTQNFGTPMNPEEVETDQNITWNTGIGILGTPVIDPSTNYMYFVSGNESQVSGAAVYTFNLNAIDITTGLPVLGSPVAINATYSTADLTSPLVFVAKKQNQRPALALANGNVYIAFASHEDNPPYHGWVLAYNAATLAQSAVYSDTTTGGYGGIWNAGGAPTIDANGNVYISTGNGSFGVTPNNLVQTGNSFIKLSPSLSLLDYFTPYNSATMNSGDQDLGSSGILLIPGTNYLLGGGKQGIFYLVNTNDMGEFNSSADQVKQEFQAVFGKGSSHIHGAPIYFNSAVNGPLTYVWGENDYLRSFTFSPTSSLLNTTPLAVSTMTAPVTNNDGAMPGGFMAISANGQNDGIIWASTPYNANAVHQSVQGVVYAFDANTLAPLWSDKDNDARDEIGTFAKYVPPVIANGKMFMATFGPKGNTAGTGALVVYGLLPTVSVTPTSLTFAPTTVGTTAGYQELTVANNGGSSLSITSIAPMGSNASSYGIRESTCGTTLAAGANCTFYVAFRPNIIGALPASIAITDSATGSPQLASVTGTGKAATTVTFTPQNLTFASTTIGTTAAAQQVKLSNISTTAMTISSIAPTGTNASSFAVVQNACGTSLAGGASCTFSVTFTPTTSGSIPGSIAVTDSSAGSPQLLAIAATGSSSTAPIASIAPSSLTFPTTTVGNASGYLLETLSNTGTAALNITNILTLGPNASSYGIRESACGSTLAVGSSCTFYVTFRPTVGGPLPASIGVLDNAAGSPQTTSVFGVGKAASTVTLAPLNLTFPATTAGSTSAPQTVTVTNGGTAAATISSIAPSGANAASFAIATNSCGKSLAAGASCTFSVTFTPTTTGSIAAAVSVTDSATGSPQYAEVTGTGNGKTGAAATLSPNTLTFPPTTVGVASGYQLQTLTNTGNATLNITNIAPSGSNASSYGIRESTCGTTLAGGANCTFYVVFRPNITGPLPVQIRVWDNAPGSPQSTSATGTGR